MQLIVSLASPELAADFMSHRRDKGDDSACANTIGHPYVQAREHDRYGGAYRKDQESDANSNHTYQRKIAPPPFFCGSEPKVPAEEFYPAGLAVLWRGAVVIRILDMWGGHSHANQCEPTASWPTRWWCFPACTKARSGYSEHRL